MFCRLIGSHRWGCNNLSLQWRKNNYGWEIVFALAYVLMSTSTIAPILLQNSCLLRCGKFKAPRKMTFKCKMLTRHKNIDWRNHKPNYGRVNWQWENRRLYCIQPTNEDHVNDQNREG